MKHIAFILLATLTQGFAQTKTVGPNGQNIAPSAFRSALSLSSDCVMLTGNQTVAGAKTFSGQMELTNQAATSSSSAMTRAQSDVRYTRIIAAARTLSTTTTSNNSSTLTDISGLSVTLTETGIYRVIGCCAVTPANSAMGEKVALTIPAGAGGAISGSCYVLNNNLMAGAFIYSATPFASFNSGDVRQVVGGVNSQPMQVRHDLIVNVATAPATIKYQFMQHTADAGVLTANIGSHIIVEKVQ